MADYDVDDPCLKPRRQTSGEGPRGGKHQQQLSTCPADPRFPMTNQTNHCYVSFVDYQKCTRLLGDYPGCEHFKICYRALCPNEWIERWEGQIEKGIFAGKIYPPKPGKSTDPVPEPPSDPCAK